MLDKLVKAVKTAEGASSGTAAIGEVVDNDAEAADKDSVTGIAKGIKEIVEAAGGSEKLKAVAAAKGESNKEAGKLFGKAGADAGANGDSEAASKAAGAVSAVSGEQILSAIVTAAGAADQDGKKPGDAKNPIAAAIGKGDADAGADFNKDGMKKDDQIAAAIALRGMAKDGKFAVKNDEKGKAEGASSGTAAIGEVVANDGDAEAADKDSVKGIAKGIKEIVEAAGGSEKLKAAAAEGENNKKAGKLFGKAGAAAGANGDSEAASKAAGAVSAVSGEQILSAIVTAAGAGEADQDGKKPEEATNPIAAAIGKGNEDDGADFDKDEMKKDDQIAAAIALRGMAKDGKFAVKGNNEKGKAEGAIKEVSELLDKLVKAVKTAEGASSGTAAIGEVVANDGDAKAADKDSVKGIAKGIKEIVEAAGGSEKLKAAAAKEGNEKAGKLFGKVDAAHAGDSEAASKAAGAVSAVSGEQILSAIVTAAGAADQDGEKPEEAKNPIAAAIGKGNAEDGAEFGNEMKKDDQIAAAIALRGMAKDGKFAVKNGGGEKEKAEGAIKGAGELLDKLVKAVKTAEGASSGTDAIGEVVANDGDAKAADKASVTGIAKGIKEIVEAAGGSEKLKVAAATGENNKGAGKLFGKAGANANGDSEAASKAAGAVSAVSGEQILSAIVKAAAADAADQEGKKPGDATNPIAAAIGNKDEDGAEFGDGMKKDDQIAAAIALRGMAKDGKFAVKNGGGEKEKAEGAIKEVSELLDKLVKAVKTAEGASSGTAAIGEVVDNDAKAADKASVTGIAKGIKEIVEAARGSEKLKAVAAEGENNKGAGKLFGKAGDDANGDSEAASKAAGAVSAVSGEQILSAIVTAAGAAEQDGEKPADATNPIAAAIGDKDGDADFGEGMKKDDQIAAAIALRGMAKDGKFAVKDGGEKEKAEGASSGTAAIGEVVDNDAKAADKDSVTGIAKGIKEIVEAAGGSEKLKALLLLKRRMKKGREVVWES